MKKVFEYDYVRAVTLIMVILGHCNYYNVMSDYGGMEVIYGGGQEYRV